MINFDEYDKEFKAKNPNIIRFHETVANHFKDKNFQNMKSDLLKSLGSNIYTDTKEVDKDFKALAFSVGSNNKSLAREKYERYK